MKKLLLFTKDESIREEICDISKMYQFDVVSLEKMSDFLKTLKQNYFLYIVDNEVLTDKNDILEILPENSIIIEKEKTNKNKIKFLLVDILKKYRIIGNTEVTINKIEKLLNNDKINTKSIGYKYLIDLMLLCYKDIKYLKKLNELAYPIIAKNHGTTILNIERNIRTTLSNIEDEHQIKQKLKCYLDELNWTKK